MFKSKCRDGVKPVLRFKTIYDFYKIFKRKGRTNIKFHTKNNIYASYAASFLNIKIINNIAGLGVVFIENNLFLGLFHFCIKQVKKSGLYLLSK